MRKDQGGPSEEDGNFQVEQTPPVPEEVPLPKDEERTIDTVEPESNPEKRKLRNLRAMVLVSLGTPRKGEQLENIELASRYAHEILMAFPELLIPDEIEVDAPTNALMGLVYMDLKKADWNNEEVIWSLIQKIPENYPNAPTLSGIVIAIEQLKKVPFERNRIIQIIIARQAINKRTDKGWTTRDVTNVDRIEVSYELGSDLIDYFREAGIELVGKKGFSVQDALDFLSTSYGLPKKIKDCDNKMREILFGALVVVSQEYPEQLELILDAPMPYLKLK